jgi:hypothetical protein
VGRLEHDAEKACPALDGVQRFAEKIMLEQKVRAG